MLRVEQHGQVRLEGIRQPVRFDDRLLTVLNQPAEDRHDAAVRWRQLVDLVARAGREQRQPGRRATRWTRSAPKRRRSTSRCVPPPPARSRRCRCRSACSNISLPTAWQCRRRCWPPRRSTRTNGERCTPPPTTKPGGSSRPCIPKLRPTPQTDRSAPACAAAPEPTVTRERAAARPPIAARGRRADRAAPADARAGDAGRGGSAADAGAAGAVPLGMRAGGEIAWVEGAPRGPLIGRSIAQAPGGDGDRVDEDVVRAFAMRAPFRDALLKRRRRRAGCGRMEDQRRARVRARRRPFRRLSRRSRCARPPAPSRSAEAAAGHAWPTPIRCASWSTRSRRRSTRSSALPRSSTANILARPIAIIATARREIVAQARLLLTRDRRSRFRGQGPCRRRPRGERGRPWRLARARRRRAAEMAAAARRRSSSLSRAPASALRRSSRSLPTGC